MRFFLKVNTVRIVCLFLMVSCFFTACTEIDVYEKNNFIPNMQWQQNYSSTGTFIIKDTTSTFNIFLILRHTDAYSYNNIWLNIGLKAPGDTGLQYQKINLQLGSDAQGWAGVGMNDIWEVRKLISGVPKRFVKPGEYKFDISQLMRDNPLQNLISVGISVEKVN